MPNVLKFMVLFLPSQKPKFMSKKGKRKENNESKAGNRVYITGTVDMTRMGYGFISSDDIEDDIFVSAKNLNKIGRAHV